MNTVIFDTCDVVFKRISDGKIVFTAVAQMSSVEQKIKEEKVKGGIGNGDVAILRTDKEVTLKVKNAIFDSAWMEMVAGVEYSSATKTVFYSQKGLVLTGGKVNLDKVPKNEDDIILINSVGKQFVATYDDVAETATIVGGAEGEMYAALYEIEVTGNVLPIDITKFAENYYVEYHTIEYSPETNKVIKDIYWQFDKVLPVSQFNISFEAGKNYSPEVEFNILKNPNSTEVGRVIEVDRV